MKKIQLFLLSCILFVSCNNQKQLNKDIVETILKDSTSYFYVDTRHYPRNDNKLPIGVFDSGTGGLTVFDAIINSDIYDNNSATPLTGGDNIKDFIKEKFIYLGDKANMPYGQYSSFNKTDLLKEHVIKDVQFLLSDKYYSRLDTNKFSTDKQPVKAIVIACNTATAYAKNDIEEFIKKAGLDIKVIGVIGAGVRGALASVQKNEDAGIGVFATFGTVCSNGYPDEIINQQKKLGYTGNIKVVQQAGIGLAGAVDGAPEYLDSKTLKPRQNYTGPSETSVEAPIDLSILKRYNFDWSGNSMLFNGTETKPENIQINSIDNYIRYHVVSMMEQLRKVENSPKLKSVILGCTHYPFYTDQFRNEFKRLYDLKEDDKFVYRDFMNESIEIIDPALNTAKELYQFIAENNLGNNSNLSESEFYISVPNADNPLIKTEDRFNFVYDYKYGRNAGEIQEYVKYVPFTKSNLGNDVINMLENKAPGTYGLIKEFVNANPKTKRIKPEDKL